MLRTKLTKALLHPKPKCKLCAVASRANLGEEGMREGTAINGARLGNSASLELQAAAPSTLNL